MGNRPAPTFMKKVHNKIRNEPASRTGAATSSSLPDEKKKQTAERDARALARSLSRITDKKTDKNFKTTKKTIFDDKKEKEEQLNKLTESWKIDGLSSPCLVRSIDKHTIPHRISWRGVHMQSQTEIC